MSAALNNLFSFNRATLPSPFSTVTNKKISVASKYGDGKQATLCFTVIKALNAVCACMNGSGEGAVGVIDHRSVAEYKSSMGPDAYHLAIFDSSTGAISATVYDKNTETGELYVLKNSGRDGAAVMMAMFPFLNRDEEFEQKFNEYFDQYTAGFPDIKAATNTMAILCDNVYRRVMDDSCEAHVKVTLDKSGNLMRVSQTQLDSGVFMPTEVVAGEFTIFAKSGRATVKKASAEVKHEDFAGKYELHTRALTPQEQALIPVLPEWYIIPDEVVDICKHAQATTEKSAPMRNFLLRGPAGTGKTMGAKAIAAGLHLPYMKYTCSANTEIFDFVGMIFPDAEGGSTGDADLDREKAELESMGGMTYENVAKIMNLPGLDDMDYDPAGVYQALTGLEKEEATAQECMAVVMERVTAKVQALSKRTEESQSGGQTYRYVDTDFIKALRYGYVIEIQEPSTIAQPGVLVGLNSLLEQSGSITLPTGEIIRRHPDAVVVVTTNISYEGCRGMNQSVLDRMSLVRDVELPSPEVMVQRAMAVTGATDEYQVGQMVQVVNDLAEYCRKNSISDGSYGMRSLIDWITSAEITGDVYQSALYTIISKATADEIDREALISAVLEPAFRPKRKTA
ncbi:MAG: ATP-binding protein [Acutalibacter muris]|nr:ATP-binding protein [Acutalibacter muris]